MPPLDTPPPPLPPFTPAHAIRGVSGALHNDDAMNSETYHGT